MIHQFILAGPKPGLSPAAFQSYWLNFHAVEYASKIPQIRNYEISTRLAIATPRQVPFFEGVAEIGLQNDAEQIASLQSPEFLLGARADEPRWSAFWQTLVLDTDPEVSVGQALAPTIAGLVKLYVLVRRAPDRDLAGFRQAARHLAADPSVAGLVRRMIGFSREGLYGLGEPRFDAVDVVTFASADALGRAAVALVDAWTAKGLADPRYLFTFAGQEHWFIRPGER